MTQVLEDQTFLTVTSERTSSLVTVKLCGELDFSNAWSLSAVTVGPSDGVERVVIDLVDLDFSDAAGIRALRALRAHHEEQGRSVDVVDACPLVQRLSCLLGE